MRLEAQGITDVGRRRSGNEDGMLVNDELGLLAVADGMGGHQAGEVASATALESLRASVASGMAIREAIETANTAVYEKASGDSAYAGMGTTLTAGTLAAGDTLILGHVGDSRAYLLRDRELRQITEDHSLVEEMVRDGRLTKEQAEHHPQRSVITRALGVDPDVDVDVFPIDLRDGDRILLCSDGLTTMVPEDVIAEILLEETDARRAADRLIAAANAAGGEDNVTAVIADFVPDRAGAPPPAAPVRPAGRTTERTEKAPRPRRRWARAALIALPVLLIIGIAVGATAWYARSNYYVGLDGTTVTVFRGLPDGLLVWDPTVERTTELEVDQLTEAQRRDLEDGKQFSSVSSANEYVERLEDSAKETERERQREQEQAQEEREQRRREQEQRERRQRRNRATSTTTTTTTPPATPAP